MLTTSLDCLVQSFFVERAQSMPDRPAVIAGDRVVSYGELLCVSQRWALRLRECGVRPNQLVAIVMEKGWEQIVGVLGILESGGAYLPIDCNVPGERLRYLLKDGQVRFVLTQSWLDGKLEWPADVQRFCIDEGINGGLDTPPLERVQTPDDLAYVLYTSGSTGSPKGVMIAHRGLVNCILETNREFEIGPTDRVLALTALHHDMSGYDIFGILAAGGCLIMPGADSIHAPDRWLDLIRRERVTVWNSVPAFMEMLLEYIGSRTGRQAGSLRVAFLGGDWIPLTTPMRIHKLLGDVQVVSVGGPTETTIWNIWYPIRHLDPSWKSIPYGHAIANTRYYVLDDTLHDCTVGAPGLLWCAGVGLMKGYWRDPERTQARFGVHPVTGDVIFCTGDRGCFRPDGEIEFLGRSDTQVKLLGQRVELGEIEAILTQHAGVRTAVVNTAPLGEQRRLVAYIVPEDGDPPSDKELRSYLNSRLPCHMVPSAFVALAAMPLNSNGKVDRQALPAPDVWRYAQEESPPSCSSISIADVIREVWKSTLRIERISPDDNFFDMGGNSLMLVQAHSELEKRLDRTISVTCLFEFPTIKALSTYLEGETREQLVVPELQQRALKQREAMARQRRMGRN